MPQLTIRGVEDQLHKALKQEADRQGQSINTFVLDLLHKALGMSKMPVQNEYDDLDHLAGIWTKEEADEFNANLKQQRQIDQTLWQ